MNYELGTANELHDILRARRSVFPAYACLSRFGWMKGMPNT